ncbi:sporulation protein YjcZ [Bacillus methanolicus]|nr:YjcZ family sporulation protein [Bacillus methanolicus]UQD51806.1 sporulation protein YjcZ [Bacillus methanolicus]
MCWGSYGAGYGGYGYYGAGYGGIGSNFALIVVLFVLLIIVGSTMFFG